MIEEIISGLESDAISKRKKSKQLFDDLLKREKSSISTIVPKNEWILLIR
jgi:hypothetical protein